MLVSHGQKQSNRIFSLPFPRRLARRFPPVHGRLHVVCPPSLFSDQSPVPDYFPPTSYSNNNTTINNNSDSTQHGLFQARFPKGYRHTAHYVQFPEIWIFAFSFCSYRSHGWGGPREPPSIRLQHTLMYHRQPEQGDAGMQKACSMLAQPWVSWMLATLTTMPLAP